MVLFRLNNMDDEMFDLEFVNNDSENRELVIQVSPQRPGQPKIQFLNLVA